MEIGIIGVPQVGKTTIFNLLTGGEAETSYGAQAKANIGVAKVPDRRLDVLSEMYNPEKTTYATIKFTDIAGLQKSESGGNKTREFLAAVRDVDALVHVVRAFENPAVPHVEGSIDPMRDLLTVQEELVMTDWGTVSARLERIEENKHKQRVDEKEVNLLTRCKEALEENIPVRNLTFSEDEEKLLRGFALFTAKPMLVVINVDEDQLRAGKYSGKEEIEEWAQEQKTPVLVISGQIEMEISRLDPEDAAMFMEDLGLTRPGIERLARTVYHHLGLISFFTTGEDEVRAWTIKEGSNARQAAGKIHSDIERGFIRAEVVSYDDLIECGSMAEAKNRGRWRLEGKDYIVQDGDVILFRFNV